VRPTVERRAGSVDPRVFVKDRPTRPTIVRVDTPNIVSSLAGWFWIAPECPYRYIVDFSKSSIEEIPASG
jgi:hypothetical protein